MPHMPKAAAAKKGFSARVYEVVARIPKGRVMTYGEVARAIGQPGASRAVGNALNANPDMRRVPCHRVVKSDGSVGGYAHGSAKKVGLLKSEGVRIVRGKVAR